MSCKKCDVRPGFHSFKMMGKTSSGKNIWYSKPALCEERAFLEESIPNYLAHLDTASTEPWIWVFDAAGLDSLIMPNPLLVRRFYLTLKKRYNHVLHRIYILNLGWKVGAILNIVRHFLNKESREHVVDCYSPLVLLNDGLPTDVIQQIAF
jgi:hypothetical protein